ncbi:hypothetical protein DICPUDRAFT_82253 [Dictyostelium purpureum]|uniref:Anoctamin transmembrane domain-containing protein n=1 Tax=Dictyostelium purpureum TaxID=5786 RepID=F0ZVZ5_DICPU|nr:uncharacterized protein DICPUDRAFT_82253 [Dictyostelium purpureum]EGC31891.1 hypothetical protein DICPUDRAFT_82253 [Dictyostelium purpureum]|eukprot:XP_003291592.1 hypothetical protein DICPUDRAFT_82253 [Dictyostelium purpureum]
MEINNHNGIEINLCENITINETIIISKNTHSNNNNDNNNNDINNNNNEISQIVKTLGEENLELEISYQVVIVFDREKQNVGNHHHITTWDDVIDRTLQRLDNISLHGVKKIGKLNKNLVFLIIGSTDERLRDFCMENNITIKNKIVKEDTKLNESSRLFIIEKILRKSKELRYIYNKDYVIDKFPYANKSFLHLDQECKKKWFYQSLDINLINDYFGEEVSFYFLFLRFYNVGLGIVSFFGLIVLIISSTRDPYRFTASAFSIVLALLSTFFFEIWKRYSSQYNWKWNQDDDYLEEEDPLPSFKPDHEDEGTYHRGLFLKKKRFGGQKLETVKKYIEMTPYMNKPERMFKLFKTICSFSVVVTLVCIIPILTIAIFTLRIVMKSIKNTTVESGIGSVINALFILIFNFFYKKLAYWLTTKEDHRLPSEFNSSYSTKLFLFQFVNSFSGLFYIAFIKDNIDLWGDAEFKDQCNEVNQINGVWQGCSKDLQFQLFSIILVNFLSSLFTELLLPWIEYYIKIIGQSKSLPKNDLRLKPWEKQFYMSNFDTFEEYNQIIIQFSYISMFAASASAAPIIAFIHNIFEDRVDTFKLINSLRRPNYNGGNGLGIWFFIIVIIGMISVLTNCLLIGFTFPTLSYFTPNTYYILWIVFILEHIIILAKVCLAHIIPDETKRLKKKKAALDLVKRVLLENERENYRLNSNLGHHNHNHITQGNLSSNSTTPTTSNSSSPLLRNANIQARISKTIHSVINIKSNVDFEDEEE